MGVPDPDWRKKLGCNVLRLCDFRSERDLREKAETRWQLKLPLRLRSVTAGAKPATTRQVMTRV
jgi:hypothetical protein